MKTKIILSALCCMGILFACDRNEHEREDVDLYPFGYMESYIAAFQPADTLKVAVAADRSYIINEQHKLIYRNSNKDVIADGKLVGIIDLLISFIPDVNGRSSDFYAGFFGYPNVLLPKSDQYEALVEQIGDTSFDQNVRQNPFYLSVGASVLDAIHTVTVTCDKDFDAAHPAGSSLNDLFTISFNDIYALIRNNYQPPVGTYQYVTYEGPLLANYPQAVIREKLSDVNFPDHPYLEVLWDCILDSAPDKTDTYTFTVNVVLENGKELQSSASIAIKGEAE